MSLPISKLLCNTALGTSVEMWLSCDYQKIQGLSPIIWIGGVHGDEPEGIELASESLKYLMKQQTNQSTKQNSVRSGLYPWIVIPNLNPDGAAAKTRVNGRGVDLNRNFPSTDWSSESEKPRYFPGSHPASEPEVSSLCELIEAVKPVLIVHCHSWNPCIVLSGPLELSAPSSKATELSKESGYVDAKRLADDSGYEIKSTIGYDTPGSLSSWGYGDKKIPVICIEEQEGVDLASVWPRFKKSVTEIFSDLDRKHLK